MDILLTWCRDWFWGSKVTFISHKEGKWFYSWCSNTYNDIVFSDPRFISAHLIPESDNPEDDKIYFFFRENAIDGEHTGKATHARIGQICKVKWCLCVRLNVLAGHRQFWKLHFHACKLFSVSPGIVVKQSDSYWIQAKIWLYV